MPFQYCINEEEVYGRFITPEDHEGFEVIGFRPPTTGELFIPKADRAPGEIERLRPCESIKTPRLILRKKNPKYRYVTDGEYRLPRIGDWVDQSDFLENGGFVLVTERNQSHYASPSTRRRCFTREEVKE